MEVVGMGGQPGNPRKKGKNIAPGTHVRKAKRNAVASSKQKKNTGRKKCRWMTKKRQIDIRQQSREPNRKKKCRDRLGQGEHCQGDFWVWVFPQGF